MKQIINKMSENQSIIWTLPKIMSIKAHFEQYFSQIFQFEHNWLDFTIFKDKSIMYL